MSGSSLRLQLLQFERLLAAIRAFFRERDVVEVATPALSPAAVTDPAIESVACEIASLGGRQYLQTSPEFAMKRLLAAGSGDIWQIARVFRDGELGRWHRPEFLLLEWYRVGFDEHALMDEVYALIERLLPRRERAEAGQAGPGLARLDLTYAEAFAPLGVDPHRAGTEDVARLEAGLAARGIDVPPATAASALLDLALSTALVPTWPAATVVFLTDYPVAQAALAAVRPGQPAVARRFEVFVDGIEIANGFAELTDAAEQRRRFLRDLDTRRAAGRHEPPIDEAFLAALESGLPDCAGVALGLDRLAALAAGATSLNWGQSPFSQY